MRTLRNWTAKRAGGRITVYGFTDDEEHRGVKVVGVDCITGNSDRKYCIATTKDGEEIRLSIG